MFFAALRTWIDATPYRRWTAVASALASMTVGVSLAYHTFSRPTPPDLSLNAEAAFDFLARGEHERLSVAEREQLFLDLGRHYFDAAPAERQDFDRRWKALDIDPEIRRRMKLQREMALAIWTAEEYKNLDQSEKGPFLDRLLFMVSAMKGGDAYIDWLVNDPSRQIITDPGSAAAELTTLQAKLVGGTSSAQRADLTRLGADLRERAQRYRY